MPRFIAQPGSSGIISPMDSINLLDAFGLAWLLAHVILGWHYGLARQVSASAAVIGGFLVAHQWCTEVSAWLTQTLDMSFPLQHIVVFLGLVGMGYGLITLLIFPFKKLIEADPSPLSMPNRILGGVASGIVATVMIYTLVSSLTWVNERFDGKVAHWFDDYQESVLVTFVEEHNAFDFLRLHEQSLLRIVANRTSSEESSYNMASLTGQKDDPFSALMDGAKELLDEHILDLIREQAWSELFQQEEVVLFLESDVATQAIAQNTQFLKNR